MILDGYENHSAYADKDRAFVHLNPDEYVLEDTEKRRNMEAENEQRKKKSTQEEEKPDNLHDQENSNIMQERLRAYLLGRGYSEKLTAGAIDAPVKASTNLQQGLCAANRAVYSLLKYGAKVHRPNPYPNQEPLF